VAGHVAVEFRVEHPFPPAAIERIEGTEVALAIQGVAQQRGARFRIA
jgi:hypothetical protein